MRLAEALIERADLNARLEQIRERTLRVARVQEGDAPAEDPAALLAEHARLAGRLEALIARINRTNLSVTLGASATDSASVGSRTMTEALARRDATKLRITYLRAVAAAASGANARVTRSELRTLPTVDVGALLAEADGLAREFRELDAEIQAANWAHDLQ